MRPVTQALNFRAFAVPVLISVIAMGCVQQWPPARTAEQECYRRISQQHSTYTASGIVFAVINARQAQQDIAFKTALKTFGKPAAARFPAEAELAKAEDELTREKAEAEAVNRKLDEIEARVEAVKVGVSGCFGIGFSGRQAAKKYAKAKKTIAKHRGYVTRKLDGVLDKHRSVAERAAFVERWRADNALHLKRKAGNADLEVVEVARLEFGFARTRVTVAVTNTTSSTILRPRNQFWTPIGTSLSDSFGNTFKLTRVKRFRATEGRGIRPGETEIYDLEFADLPLENAKSVRIAVKPGAYGQSQRAIFDIPAEAFFKGMVGGSQHRR